MRIYKSNNIPCEMIYSKEYFIKWGKNEAKKSIESLRKDLNSISDD